ncbi:MAG TPA: hypothetical protein VLF91_05640 [Candidatus Saccharimonadales bacterium]|nr:hypothetical protein [Candidatus Saccharimonadales bacterium]
MKRTVSTIVLFVLLILTVVALTKLDNGSALSATHAAATTVTVR